MAAAARRGRLLLRGDVVGYKIKKKLDDNPLELQPLHAKALAVFAANDALADTGIAGRHRRGAIGGKQAPVRAYGRVSVTSAELMSSSMNTIRSRGPATASSWSRLILALPKS